MAQALETGSCENSQISQTPARKGLEVPFGHIVVKRIWSGSGLVASLQGSVSVLYDDNLGVVDFHPSSSTAVLYLTDKQLKEGNCYKRTITKLRKKDNVRGIVMVEKSEATRKYFYGVQEFTVHMLGMMLVPVSDDTEAANFLKQLVHAENNPESNQLRKRPKGPPTDTALINTISTLPKLGDVKAKLLVEKFESLNGIANASVNDLAPVIGRPQAQAVYDFFNAQHLQ